MLLLLMRHDRILLPLQLLLNHVFMLMERKVMGLFFHTIMVSTIHNRVMMVAWRLMVVDVRLDVCHCVMNELRLFMGSHEVHIML